MTRSYTSEYRSHWDSATRGPQRVKNNLRYVTQYREMATDEAHGAVANEVDSNALLLDLHAEVRTHLHSPYGLTVPQRIPRPSAALGECCTHCPSAALISIPSRSHSVQLSDPAHNRDRREVVWVWREIRESIGAVQQSPFVTRLSTASDALLTIIQPCTLHRMQGCSLGHSPRNTSSCVVRAWRECLSCVTRVCVR